MRYIILLFFTIVSFGGNRFSAGTNIADSAHYSGRSFLGRGMLVASSKVDFYITNMTNSEYNKILNNDNDGDKLSDSIELNIYSTDPNNSDSDNDLLDDDKEIFTYNTDPNNADSDNDQITDGWEINNGLNPLLGTDSFIDSDKDGASNYYEFLKGTDPHRYVISLNPGWNNISLATLPIDNSVSTILGNNYLGSVWIWENNHYKRVTEIEPLRGHWVYSINSTNKIEIDINLP